MTRAMAKTRKASPKKESPKAEATAASGPRKDSVRETVESVAVAFILAFLFRTFEAEAFVIPTGSMAPTLMGQHKDVACEKCGYAYRVNASDEESRGIDVVRCTCPLCRYTMNVDPDTPEGSRYRTFKGDRLLVAKFPYELSDPKRWDVAVFKYPEMAKVNYIKRVAGLPNETLRIYHGDILTRPKGQPEFNIARKPPEKVRAMWQVVYDNDYVLDELIDHGWPSRWYEPNEAGAPAGGWKTIPGGDRKYASFAADGSREAWLRYRHIVPLQDDWNAWTSDHVPPLAPGTVRGERIPQLITDFYAYNTNEARNAFSFSPDLLGQHWVGDLAVECQLKSASAQGTVTLELIEGGRQFRCRFDLATGRATLSISGLPDFKPEADTAVLGSGSHRVAFANVDDQLLLWVDDRLVKFNTSTEYSDLDNHRPTPADLSPAGIGSEGAEVQIDHLRLLRDIYYISARNGAMNDYGNSQHRDRDFFIDPRRWDEFERLQSTDFELGEGQFLMLGDNSPASKDSRLWDGRDEKNNPEYYVKHDLLIGKAVYVYWPHGLDHIGPVPVPLPLVPNIPKMRLVR